MDRGSHQNGGIGMTSLPLEGVRVLDFAWVWAGPVQSLQLAYLGAEVIKVESSMPARLDTIRRLPPYADDEPGPNRSGYFNQYNQGKKSITLDLKSPAGLRIAKDLIAHCDVVAENFASGVIDRMGLGYDVVSEIKPDAVMISFSGYGRTGPKKDYIAYGPAQVPMIGLASLSGYAGGQPREVGLSYGDPNGGLHAACAVLLALYHRARTGQGQYIDMAQWEAGVGLTAEGFMDQAMNGSQPPRMGNRDQWEAPQGCFPCAGDDEWLSIACWSDEEWRALATAMGRPEIGKDSRFGDAPSRKAHEGEIEAAIANWTRSRDRWALTQALQAVGVAAYPAMSNRDLVESAHLAERGYFVELDHPEVGVRRHAGMPWKFSETPLAVRTPAPLLGQHTDVVLAEILGYTGEQIASFREAGALS